jgi:hypothetical protein
MEYVRERGTYLDLPYDDIMRTLHETYGSGLAKGGTAGPVRQDPAFEP